MSSNATPLALCINLSFTLPSSLYPDDCPQSYTLVPLVIVSSLLTTLSLGTCIDNVLMITAIGLVRRLQTPCNMLILNLALTDLMVGVFVIPFASVYQIMGYWVFSELMCDVFILFDVLLCTSSILNLCAISVDRYLVITQPFTYAIKRTRARMLFMIVLVWTASALISIPPLFGWRQPRPPYTCDYSKDLGYQIYATFIAFYLPLVVMLVLYGRIFRLAKAMVATERSQAKFQSRTISPDHCSDSLCAGHPESRKNSIQIIDPTLSSQTNLNLLSWGPVAKKILKPFTRQLSFRNRQDTSTGSNFSFTDNLGSSNSKRTASNHCHSDMCSPQHTIPAIHIDSIIDTDNNNKNSCDYDKSNTSRHISGSMIDIHMTSDTGSSRRSSFANFTGSHKPHKATAEAKAVRTLGIIMGCFTICWLPFFLFQIINPLFQLLGIKYESYAIGLCFQIFYWLGYTNSFLNPLIYAKFNREFRRPFIHILLCQCRNINARIRTQNFRSQYGDRQSQNNNNHNSHCYSPTSNNLPLLSSSRRPSTRSLTPSCPASPKRRPSKRNRNNFNLLQKSSNSDDHPRHLLP